MTRTNAPSKDNNMIYPESYGIWFELCNYFEGNTKFDGPSIGRKFNSLCNIIKLN